MANNLEPTNIEKPSSKRVVFTFDERSFNTLKEITDDADFKSMAQTVREALRITQALVSFAQKGYSEVIVRNPDTKAQREIVIPVLHDLAKH